MGLRESKKQKVRASIIENAVALFRELGFEATTVREISAASEVSEATFFNYFPAKDAVLSDWVTDFVVSHLDAASLASEAGLRRVVRGLCDSIAGAVEEDCEFAARAWVRARIPAGPPEAAVRLMKAGQDGGQLRRDLSARQLGAIFYLAICGTIADWLGREEPRGPLALELRRATDLVLDGSRRRNERVRPTARVTSAPQPASTR